MQVPSLKYMYLNWDLLLFILVINDIHVTNINFPLEQVPFYLTLAELCLFQLNQLKVINVEQELPALPEHLSSSAVFSRVRVARSLVFCVVFCR